MGMRKLLFVVLLVVAGATSVVAHPPAVEEGGGYRNNTWSWWQVCAEGVDVRTSTALKTLLETPRARWPEVDPMTWSPTWTLPRGYVARARVVDGTTLLTDGRGERWLIIDLGQGRTGVAPANGRCFWPSDAEPVKPDAKGDYRRTPHVFWEVVDPDPPGLNARQHPKFPRASEIETASWPEGRVSDWPVVAKIPKGTVLQALSGNVGVLWYRDTSGAVWLLVHHGQGLVFVRWNQRFVRPVAGPVRPFKSRRG